jgi:polyisoprenoid-binding protein YceI
VTTPGTTAVAEGDQQSLTGEYEIDPDNTRIGFAARYAMVTTVRGVFSELSGRVHLAGDDPTRSAVDVLIAADSLSTAQAQRDEHLRSVDFLDVETYPEIVFRSTDVSAVGPGRYQVSGELTICGVTKVVPLEIAVTGTSTDPSGRQLVGFEGAASISRADFGLTWNAILETGGVLVSDEVDLQLDVSLIRTVREAAGDEAEAATPTSSRWRRLLRPTRS